MAHIIAIVNHKGGVGKTTSVANIGAALAKMGRKVLMVDLDAQQNLTATFMSEEAAAPYSIYEPLLGRTKLRVMPVSEGGALRMAPSSIDLARVEIDLSHRLAREHALSRCLKDVEEDFDYILLDCPPSLGIITTNALMAATDVIVPLTGEMLPLVGLKMLESVIKEIRDTIKPELSVTGIFLTRYGGRKLNSLVKEELEKYYGPVMFQTKIRENIAVAEAPLERKPVIDYAPGSNGAKDYLDLVDEIVARVERKEGK